MSRAWLWAAAGTAGAAFLWSRRHRLISPITGVATPVTTPHGDYGAHREGPPAHTHHGLDLVVPAGGRIVAVADGTIIPADPGLGKIVRKLKLDAPAPWSATGEPVEAVVYADLGTPLVEVGDRVRKGEVVALVDKSGFFHFAVKAHGDQFIEPSRAGFEYRAPGEEKKSWLFV